MSDPTDRPAQGTTPPPGTRLSTPISYSPIPDYPTPSVGGSSTLHTPGSLEYYLDLTGNGTSVVPRSTASKTQKKVQDTQVQCCALNEPLRFGYGRNRVGAMLLRPIVYQNALFVPFIIGAGGLSGIDAVEAVHIDDAALPSDVTAQTYLGAPAQIIDPTLKAAWLAQSITYADTLPGIAWGWCRFVSRKQAGFTAISIIARMMKVYDPRLDSTNGGSGSQRLATPSTWTYSNCPALCLADFLTSKAYGKGETMDWASVITLANLNDATVGSNPRRSLNLMIEQSVDLDSWEETIRMYAGCWIVREGGLTRLVPDAAGSVVYAFTNAGGSANYIADSIKISQAKRGAMPTVVSIVWTDTTQTPWAAQTWTEVSAGALAGTLPWREEVVQMPGCQDVSMAKREAVRRLNGYLIADISLQLIATDPAITLRRGDIVSVTDSYGLTAKQFRLVGHKPQAPGRWLETMTEYDPLLYSSAVVTQGSTPDTTLPSPATPPVVTGLTLAEEIYQVQTGLFASRIRADWTEPSYPFTTSYQVDVLQGGVLIDSGQVGVGSSEYVSKALPEGLLYTVNVTVRSTVGALGSPVSATITNNGKSAKPSDVPVFNAYEAAGAVRFNWVNATDLDLTAHEIRYAPRVSYAWATATVLDRIAKPGIRYDTQAVPPGDYTFGIKGLDSVRSATYPNGQESVNDTRFNLVISGNPDLFLAAQYSFATPSLTNMVALASSPPTWQTDYGTAWSTLFPTAMSGFTNALASYFGTGTSTLLTETFDAGQVYSGLLTNTATWTDISGTATVFLESSLDNVVFTQFPGQSAQVAGRYFRFRITTTGVVLVTSMGSIQILVVAVSETGSVMTSTTGWTTVTLTRKYSKVRTIQLTSDGSLGVANPVYDQNSITLVGDPRYLAVTYIPEDYVDEAYSPLGSFAVECFDSNNALLARLTNYLFQGI